jgi:uncharacterized membrane protein YeaQ/YmgE (transglycosylase-associated protein family)
MGVILWIIFGGIVGWIASVIVGTDNQQGLVGNVVLGVIGALIGGFLSSLLGLPGVTGFNLYSALLALGGALVAVAIGKAIKLV